MKLTDKACRNLKATSPELRLADGGNLYLHALPGGTKSWRFRYRFAGKQKQIVLGTYPELSLAAARKARNELQALVDDGQDPSVVRHQEKVTKRAEALDSFELVAREWHREATSNRAPRYARQILERFERHVFKEFGAIPIKKVSAPMVLDAIRKIEKTGALEMAHRVRIHVSDVFVWAISSGLAETDPAALIKKALKPREPELRPAMLRCQQVLGGHALDVEELVLRSHLGNRQELDPVRLALGGVDEQVAEVPHALCPAQRLSDRVGALVGDAFIGQVEDEASVAAVEVVPPPENRRRLVEQARLQGREIFRHAVDLLHRVGLHHVEDRPGAIFDRIGDPPGARRPEELVRLQPDARPCRRRASQRKRPARQVVHSLHVAVPHHEEVERPLLELGHGQPARGHEARCEQVALEQDRALVVRGHAIGAAQPDQFDRRLVPAIVVRHLEHVEDLAPVDHALRIAEGEGDVGFNRRLGAIRIDRASRDRQVPDVGRMVPRQTPSPIVALSHYRKPPLWWCRSRAR
ncbi:DUF4102 domain-containing protein [Novosphingobium sp. ES2-1]|nr:DUF4102 domain-containing protein [Novosphingobium sp. ES2-1]